MSLKLYLSGAATFEGQSEPVRSLGQYPSSTEIQNASLNNLFGDISRYSVGLNKNEVRAIVLKNEGATTLAGLKVWFDYPNEESDSQDFTNDAEFDIQYIALTTDSCGDTVFPYSVTNPYSIPYNISFQSGKVFEENALLLPDLEPGMMLGIWIKRKLKASLQSPLSADELVDILDGAVVLDTQEDIEMVFGWDD